MPDNESLHPEVEQKAGNSSATPEAKVDVTSALTGANERFRERARSMLARIGGRLHMLPPAERSTVVQQVDNTVTALHTNQEEIASTLIPPVAEVSIAPEIAEVDPVEEFAEVPTTEEMKILGELRTRLEEAGFADDNLVTFLFLREPGVANDILVKKEKEEKESGSYAISLSRLAARMTDLSEKAKLGMVNSEERVSKESITFNPPAQSETDGSVETEDGKQTIVTLSKRIVSSDEQSKIPLVSEKATNVHFMDYEIKGAVEEVGEAETKDYLVDPASIVIEKVRDYELPVDLRSYRNGSWRLRYDEGHMAFKGLPELVLQVKRDVLEEEKKIASRRNFLKGAGALGVVAASGAGFEPVTHLLAGETQEKHTDSEQEAKSQYEAYAEKRAHVADMELSDLLGIDKYLDYAIQTVRESQFLQKDTAFTKRDLEHVVDEHKSSRLDAFMALMKKFTPLNNHGFYYAAEPPIGSRDESLFFMYPMSTYDHALLTAVSYASAAKRKLSKDLVVSKQERCLQAVADSFLVYQREMMALQAEMPAGENPAHPTDEQLQRRNTAIEKAQEALVKNYPFDTSLFRPLDSKLLAKESLAVRSAGRAHSYIGNLTTVLKERFHWQELYPQLV